jgi:hypothetical protein
MGRARSFAQFILSGQSEILLPLGGIRMTAKDSGCSEAFSRRLLWTLKR